MKNASVRQEAAVILKVKDSILRSLVSKRAVPLQPTGKPLLDTARSHL